MKTLETMLVALGIALAPFLGSSSGLYIISGNFADTKVWYLNGTTTKVDI